MLFSRHLSRLISPLLTTSLNDKSFHKLTETKLRYIPKLQKFDCFSLFGADFFIEKKPSDILHK